MKYNALASAPVPFVLYLRRNTRLKYNEILRKTQRTKKQTKHSGIKFLFLLYPLFSPGLWDHFAATDIYTEKKGKHTLFSLCNLFKNYIYTEHKGKHITLFSLCITLLRTTSIHNTCKQAKPTLFSAEAWKSILMGKTYPTKLTVFYFSWNHVICM